MVEKSNIVNSIIEGENFWLEQIDLAKQSSKIRADIFKNGYNKQTFVIDEKSSITNDIKNKCKNNIFLQYTFLLSALSIVLYKYGLSKDISIGIQNQKVNDKSMVFINKLLPLGVKMDSKKTCKEFMSSLRKSILSCYDNQISFSNEFIEKNKINENIEDLVQLVMCLEDYNDNNFTETLINSDKNQIAFSVKMYDDSFTVSVIYNGNLYLESTIKNLVLHYISVIKQIINSFDNKIESIEIIENREKDIILNKFNDTKKEYDKTDTIVSAFEKQVRKSSINIAVVDDKQKLTYTQVNQKANQVARYLVDKGVANNDVVAIILDKSADMIISILSVLKAGATYLPIDKTLPKDRIDYILQDSHATCILTDSTYDLNIGADNVIRTFIDDDKINQYDFENLDIDINPANHAYIIYTSGSTGKPKGVLIKHTSVINLCQWFKKEYNVLPSTSVMQLANFSFDVSVEEIFGAILNGASIHLTVGDNIYDKEKFKNYILSHKINIVQFVPALMKELILDNDKMDCIKVLICGGDALTTSMKSEVLKKGYNLYNCYGPTESTVDAITTKCDDNPTVVIGRPIDNTSIYVINADKQLLPIGLAGELCISGTGLSTGYLNNVELTNEKFIDNPFVVDTKMYRTGDLARFLSDGTIEFLGRIDNQVKVRGFRIELDEIESAIQGYDGINKVAVVVKEINGEKFICAYICSDEDIDISKLKDFIKQSLPEYMVPTYFVKLDKMPLTSNDKIDRKALPEPTTENMANQYEAATNETEEKLVAIWEKILSAKKIGINDNFFEIGGHSILAIQLISEIHKVLHKEIKLNQLFDIPTIKEIATFIDKLEVVDYVEIDKINKKEYYETSSAQKRMYMLQNMDKNSTAYNMPMVFEIVGDVSTEKLQGIFTNLINRHDVFKTYFEIIENEIVQKINDSVNFSISYGQDDREINSIIADFIRPFDLSTDPLLRVQQISNKDKNYLMIDMHHIISDGISMDVLTEEFVRLYNDEELPELIIQYVDFAAWQNKQLLSDKMIAEEKYWLSTFEDELPVLNIKTDFERPTIQSFEGDIQNFTIDKGLSLSLTELSKKTGTTMYMLLLSAFDILLSKYSGQEDIIVGTPITGRTHADIQNMIGLFVNTLALRNKPSGDKTFAEFLSEVKENSLKAFENQDYQFETLIDKLDIKRDTSRNPMFDVMFSMINVQQDLQDINTNNLTLRPIDNEAKTAKFDLTLNIAEVNEMLVFSIVYCSKLYKNETINRFGQCYIKILEQICSKNSIRLQDIEIAQESDIDTILNKFNDNNLVFDENKTIAGLFEEQVKRRPDNIAVVFNKERITYKKLNDRANSLAYLLRENGVKPNDIVGLMVERSVEMIVGIMGIIKSGAAYMPIDTTLPKERIEYMLSDSNSKALLGDKALTDGIKFGGINIDIYDENIYKNNKSNNEIVNTPHDLVYVIYTSGTTGKPKGVMVEQINLNNLVVGLNEQVYKQYNKSLKSGLVSPYYFDASVGIIFPTILNGHTLHVIDDETRRDGEKLVDYYLNNNIEVADGTPIHLKMMLSVSDKEKLNRLNILHYVIGGEELKYIVAKELLSHNDASISNVYGPTECCVDSTIYTINRENIDLYKNIPIGKPMPNYKVYIVDKNNKSMPVGVPGELCIAGKGVSSGYLNREDLNNQKFVNDIFNDKAKMYKTGDLACWLEDGNIEFLGRIDNQVKIRGYRIELGEIENRILENQYVSECAVIIKQTDNDKYICAYIVSEKELDKLDLKGYLKQSLPNYMIPTYIVKIDKLPMTSNGKLNKKLLPDIDFNISDNDYQAPRTLTEQKLADIWSNVLGVEKIGINDNFFDLGGHSLKAMIIMSSIHKEMSKEVALSKLFNAPTIKELSEYIDSLDNNEFVPIQSLENSEYYETSSAQKRTYMVQEFEKESTAYNIPLTVQIPSEEKKNLEMVINKLITRHEALRTYFEQIDGKIVQKVLDNYHLEIQTIKSIGSLAETKNSLIKPFELSKCPLFRAKFIDDNDKSYLFVDFHHIISDYVSTNILTRDFINLYNGVELEPLKVQYKDFAAWQNELFNSDKIKKQEEYWLSQFEDEIPVLNMPTDFERPAVRSYEGSSIKFDIRNDKIQKLEELMKSTGTTKNMILLSVLNILLNKYSGQEDIIIGTPVSGRTHPDTNNILGIFINSLALRNRPKGEKTYKEFLKEVKITTLGAIENQDYQFDKLVEKLSVKRDKSRNPIFDIMFNILDYTSFRASAEDIDNLDKQSFDNTSSKFDLSWTAIDFGSRINFTIDYCTKLYKKETIERFATHFVNILSTVLENNNIAINDINMLAEDEKKIILHDFNDTKFDYDHNLTIKDMFEQQVEKTPNNIAVVFGETQYTYDEFNKKSNCIAYKLIQMGVKEDTVVGIMVDRSAKMLIGIMGIIKSGGAYLPIDPTFPKERIDYMLENSKCNILISQEEYIELMDFKGSTINLYDDSIFDEHTNNLETTSTPNSLSYIIYTSGTTGNPKGVMIETRNVVNFVYGITNMTHINDYKAILNLTTMCFDIFNLETIVPLTQGMKVVVSNNKDQTDSEKLGKIIQEQNIDVLQSTPTRLDMMLENKFFKETMKNIKLLLVGGEEVQKKVADKILEYDDLITYNVYGPTETTIWSTATKIEKDKKILIGKPISNTQIYILNAKNQVVPLGVAGELCIAGDGVARGYFNREDLTNEKFIDNPFDIGTKMYKTGDLVRWLPDGNLDFLGRIDHQVKIRGYRIELAEIENRLLEHEHISDAVVLPRNNNMHLCAYIVCTADLNNKEIKQFIKEKLPEYMVPQQYVKLEQMPYTPNGKVDRKALLAIKVQRDTENKVKPRSLQEYTIADIWQNVLGVDEVFVDDDFFDLGGNSINVVQVASQIKEKLDFDITIANLMVFTTVVDLAEFIIQSCTNSEQKKYKFMYKINNSKSEQNIFIFHGGDADIFYYRHLAKLLEDKYSVYGIQPKGLSGREALPVSYYEMERDYMAEIKELQPEGPYIIAGYCVGAYMAYDITRVMELQGDEVIACLQIDQEPFVHERNIEKVRLVQKNLLLTERYRRLKKFDKSYTMDHMVKIFEQKHEISKEHQMEVISSRKSIHIFFCNELLGNCNFYFNTEKLHKTPTLVIKAELNNNILFEKSCWEYMTNDLTYYEVPGEHETVILPPYINEVAKIILDYLEELEYKNNQKNLKNYIRKKRNAFAKYLGSRWEKKNQEGDSNDEEGKDNNDNDNKQKDKKEDNEKNQNTPSTAE